MITKEIEAPKVGRKIVLNIKIPESLQEKVAAWGEDKVNNLSDRMAVTDVGNAARAKMNKGEEDKQIHDWVESWTPGMSSVGQVDYFAYMQNLAQNNPEEFERVIAEAKAARAAQE